MSKSTDEEKVAKAARKEPRAEGSGSSSAIFIVGVMPRSGTNFLHRLVCLHPDCGAVNTTPVREDYMLHHAEHLNRFVHRLKWQWGQWGAPQALIDELTTYVGYGLTSFLHALTDAPRVVTKTPSVANVAQARRLFPDAHLLIIVRDGRSVVASGMSGFKWNFETASRKWARAAREILSFRNRVASSDFRQMVVRYEDLSQDTHAELGRILDFLGLDRSRYDYEKAAQLPLFGSSFVQPEDASMTWQPVEKPRSFDASQRFAHWTRYKHERFNRIAAKELEAFGYEPRKFERSRLLWAIINSAASAWYYVRRLPGRIYLGVKQGVKRFLAEMHTSR